MYPQMYQHPYHQQINVPQPTMTQQLQLPTNKKTPKPTHLHIQPIANPNNKTSQPIFNIELPHFLTYLITATPLQGI